ncbi:MAG: 16S rRNA processing protein RimM [Coriobacteriia bacterium]|nr:16S rRNA processing protein RimM [Coriobacteriia bacterium]
MLKDNQDVTTKRFVTVGTIRKSHGLNGEVLVAFATGASLPVLVGKRVWVAPPTRKVSEGVFSSIDEFGGGYLVKLSNVDSIGEASNLSNKSLICAVEDLPGDVVDALRNDFDPDSVVEFKVSSDNYGDLGVVSEYLVTKANDCIVVKGLYGELILPIIDEVLLDVDYEHKIMYVHVQKGTIESDPL